MRDLRLPQALASAPPAAARAAAPAGALGRWLAGSIANRITLTAASLTAAVMLVLGIAAYGFALDALTRFAQAELRAQAQLVARRLSLLLTEVERDLSALAASTVAARGFGDPAGHDAFVRPLLQARPLPPELPFSITLVDRRGLSLASNRAAPVPDYRAARWLGDLISQGGARTELSAQRVVIAVPVRDGGGAPAGALVFEAALAPLFGEAAAQAPGTERWLLAADTPLLQMSADGAAVRADAARPLPADGGAALLALEPVALGGSLAALRLSVLLKRPDGAPVDLPDGQLASMLVLGAVMLALVVLVSRLAARRLTAPLATLAGAAERITSDGHLAHSVPALGRDEVGVLAAALDGMLVRLRAAHEGLEAQVADRTAALALAQQRTAVIVEQMHDGLVLLDADGQIELLNHAAETLFGVREEHVLGLHMSRLVAGWFKAARAPIQEGAQRFVLTDLVARRGDSGSFSADCAVALIETAERRQWSLLVRDVTERRRAAEALRLANERLRRSVAELQRRDGQMAKINRMNDLLQACQSLDEAYLVIGDTMAALFDGGGGMLAVAGAGVDRPLEAVARWGAAASAPACGAQAFSAVDCWALRLGRVHCPDAAAGSPRCAHLPPAGPYRHVCVPLTIEGRAVGALSAAFDPAEAQADTPVLTMAAESIRAALANLRLRTALSEQALCDQLTGLFNRRYLDEALRRELERARRNEQPLAVVMIDLDHFKRFNDDYGHEAGDHVLREIARLLRARLRAADIVCRYGGEELTVLMPGTSLADACDRLDRLRVEVAGMLLTLDGMQLPPVTVSMGVAAAEPDHMAPKDVIRAADHALYSAKAGGRNRVHRGPSAGGAAG